MKIKNLAFFGIMAAILGVESSARADTTTIIASQAYVDAKDDLKLNVSSVNTGSLVSNSTSTVPSEQTVYNAIQNAVPSASNYVTDGTNALSMTDSSDHAPSVTAVKGMKTTSVRASDTAVDTLLPTEAAVRSAINSSASTITGNFENARAAGANLTELNAALADNERAAEVAAIHNTVIDTELQKIPHNYNIQKGIAYLKGTGIENYTSGVKNDKTANVGIQNDTVKDTASREWANNLNEHGDEFVPTVASVERRVQEAEASAGTSLTNAKDDTASATYSNGAVAFATSGQDGNQTTKLATSHAVKEGLEAIKDYADNKLGALDNASEAEDTNNTIHTPIVAVTQTDGVVTATRGTISGAGIEDGTVQYQFDMNNTALYDINTGAVPTSSVCTESNPCVLTYYKKDNHVFTRWTPMDTEDTSANSSTDDAGASVS